MANPFPSYIETVSEYQECRTHRGSELQMNVGGCRKFIAKTSTVSLFGFGKTTATDVCATCDCPRSNHVKREVKRKVPFATVRSWYDVGMSFLGKKN